MSKWDMSNVKDMSYMFSEAGAKFGSFKYFAVYFDNISNWDVSNCENMDYMFNKVASVENLDLSSWDVSSVKYRNRFAYDSENIISPFN